MTTPFSISGSQCSVPFSTSLREKILYCTGSERETTSILRSIERFAGDPSVRVYEMSPKPAQSARYGTRHITWIVRAVRH